MDKDPVEELKKELVRIFEPLFFKAVYLLGRFSKQVRLESYESGKYMWGLIRFIEDNPEPTAKSNDCLTADQLEEFIYQLTGRKKWSICDKRNKIIIKKK